GTIARARSHSANIKVFWPTIKRKIAALHTTIISSHAPRAFGAQRRSCSRVAPFARHLNLPNDLARVIHYADTGYVQSSKMLHAALLLLMLEAATELTSVRSKSRSAPNPHRCAALCSRRPLR